MRRVLFERDTMRFYKLQKRKTGDLRIYKGVHGKRVKELKAEAAKRRDTAPMLCFKLIMRDQSEVKCRQDIAHRIPDLLVDCDDVGEANRDRVNVRETMKRIEDLINETYKLLNEELKDDEMSTEFMSRWLKLETWVERKSEAMSDLDKFRGLVARHAAKPDRRQVTIEEVIAAGGYTNEEDCS